jgi:hypothetical protein
VRRLLLRHGVEDRAALTELLDEARRQGTCLCPHCYAQVPVPDDGPPRWRFSRGNLYGSGCSIELSEDGLLPRLFVESPEGVIYAGREPGRLPTLQGAMAFLVGPAVLTAFLVAEITTSSHLPWWVIVMLALGVGLLVSGLIYLFWPAGQHGRDRLIDWAWRLLVPELIQSGPSDAALECVGGLARVSVGLGDPAPRAEHLQAVREDVDERVQKHPASVPHLAALWRLTAEDNMADPVRLLAKQAGRCFDAELPLSYATHLFQDVFADGLDEKPRWWTRGQGSRLQILLCERAFATGLELCDLLDIGQANRALGSALGLEGLDNLARLRLLWSLRTSRPWERVGAAVNAFDVAGQGPTGSKLLAQFSDVLLMPAGTPLLLCGRGAHFGDCWFTNLPEVMEVHAPRGQAGDFELVIGEQHFYFSYNPEALAGRLEKWFRYFFRDFMPQVDAVQAWRSANVAAKLLACNGVPCPDCHQQVLVRAGNLGRTLDERVVATWI